MYFLVKQNYNYIIFNTLIQTLLTVLWETLTQNNKF